MKNSTNKKLGIKYLDSIQMQNSFPDCDALISRIADQREIAESYQPFINDSQELEDEYYQMYDNVYAILGGRGSGKSSVIFSLRERLKAQNTEDIYYPIIVPENIGDKNCSILGWIMAMTGTIIDKLEAEVSLVAANNIGIQRQISNSCRIDFFKNCQFQKHNELREWYNSLFQDSFQNVVIASNYLDEDVDTKAYRSRKQYQLHQQLNKFWRTLTRVKQELQKIKGSNNHTSVPLIIFMFDDIDLSPERIMELLTNTFQYFASPNIVLILTAAEKDLKRVIQYKMYEKLIGSRYPSHLKGLIDEEKSLLFPVNSEIVTKMMDEFYNKTIPPINRYRINRYETIEQRRSYYYANSLQGFEYHFDPISTSIENFLLQQINDLVDFLPNHEKRKNFLLSPFNVFRVSYFVIFGNKNRNIANVCLELINTIDRLKTIWSEKKGAELTIHDFGKIKNTLIHLLHSIIISNFELSLYTSYISDFIINSNDNHQLFINYPLINELYFLEQSNCNDEKVIKKSKLRLISLLTSLCFIENLLLLIDPDRGNIHGHRELVNLLNQNVQSKRMGKETLLSIKLFYSDKSINDIMDNTPLLFENASKYVCYNPYGLRSAQDYLNDLFPILSYPTCYDVLKRLKTANHGDQTWVESVLTNLFIFNSGINLIDQDFNEFFKAHENLFELFSFSGFFVEDAKKAFISFMEQDSLPQYSDKILKYFKENLLNEDFFSIFSNGLGEFTELTLGGRYDQMINILKTDPDFIEKVASYFWNEYLTEKPEEDSTPEKDISHDIIQFVEDKIKYILTQFQMNLNIKIKYDNLKNLKEVLDNVEPTDFNAYSIKNNCLLVVNKVLSYYSYIHDENYRKKNEFSEYNEIRANETWKDQYATFDAQSLISLTMLLRDSFNFESSIINDNDYFPFLITSASYFQILSYFDVIPIHQNNEEGTLPLSSRIILLIHVIKDMLPLYFASKFTIVYNSRYESEKVDPKSKLRRTENERFRNLFHNIVNGDEEYKEFLEPMKEIKKKTVIHRIKILEAEKGE